MIKVKRKEEQRAREKFSNNQSIIILITNHIDRLLKTKVKAENGVDSSVG